MNQVGFTLKSLNGDGRRGVAFLALAVALLLPSLLGEGMRAALRYDRAALAHEQLWRLVTAHLVHLDLHHALLNILGLALVWALFAREYGPRAWLLIALASMAAIDAGLWFADSTIEWYVGSSGVLHGAMAAGAVALIRARDLRGWVLAVILAGKLLYEQVTGPLPLSGHDPVVVDAHLYGLIGGVLMACSLPARSRPI